MSMNKTRASLGGALAAAFAASACCIGPLIFALLGIGGAGFMVVLEPYRPLFTVLTVGLLGFGFYMTYRKPVAASGASASGAEADDCGCEMPETNKTGKLLLWVATGLVAIALLFPYITPYLF